MANVIKASFQREKAPVPDKDQPEVTTDGPLLDLADAEVTKMIKRAKKRGYITHQQINAVLPSDEHTSEKIENILAMLNDMGINTVEQDEAEPDEEEKAADEKLTALAEGGINQEAADAHPTDEEGEEKPSGRRASSETRRKISKSAGRSAAARR